MGFLESLGRFMSKIVPQGSNANWEENLTKEQIDDLERQGCDVVEIRQRYEARIAAKKQAEQKLIDDSLAAINMSKLAAYIATPREAESEFVKEVAALNSISNKNLKTLTEAPIVYGAVVQAHNALWTPGNSNERMGIVFVFALDKEHMHDEQFLNKMADKISELKRNANIPDDCKKFIRTLCDNQSYFCFKVGDSISEGANLWCATYTWKKQADLPLGYLPATGIVPLVLMDQPKENQFAQFEVIPAKFYTK